MKSFQQQLADLGKRLGKNTNSLSESISEVPNYSERRKQYDAQANNDIAKLQLETKQARIQALYGASELNESWTFDRLIEDSADVKEAISIAQAFIGAHSDPSWRNSRAHMMIFYGDYGRGKSHIAGAIAHQLIQQFEITVLYRQLQTLLELRFFSYDYQAEDKASMKFREISKQLLDVDLLILDEVCVNQTILKQSAQSWLGSLLRQRCADNKNCILITNHHFNDLPKALGTYCFESIKEYETYKVQFQGPSRRGSHEEPDELSSKSGYQPNQF
ncbi:ATP-binding protein [Agaribacter marinus]|uniref:DNA replication protein n=1 Tax=Agaribacter marinus TaxID=1431249 RepID=A0AA37SZL5_9ALTE|nr:ATP-binding protein [Agaribacter marinus]GLR71274.1 DNA replication protein [Agaribacter marinus]